MTLPRKIAKEPKRSERWRSQAHCSFVRSFHCSVPGCQGMPIEVAHVRSGSDGGMGKRPSDWNTISLCRDHHSEQHRIGEKSFERKHGIDMAALAEEFSKASPKSSEIRKVKAERENG